MSGSGSPPDTGSAPHAGSATGAGPDLEAADIAHLEAIARRIRVEIVRTVNHARGGHLCGPLSTVADILAALYFRVARVRPVEPDCPDRDRLVLSKGHSSIALYAAMALRGLSERQ